MALLDIISSPSNAIDTAQRAVQNGISAVSVATSAINSAIANKQDIAAKASTQTTSKIAGKNPPQVPKAPRLNTFISLVKQNSISRQSHFYTCIYPPNTLTADYYNSASIEEISLYIEQASLPELSIQTMPNHVTGLGIDIPYDKSFGKTLLTFVCDQQMKIKSFFDKWIMSIMQTPNGVFEYYDNYIVKELPVVLTDAALNPVYMVVFYDAYPRLVNDVYLSSSGRDYNRIQVQFTYREWKSFSIESQTTNNANSIVPSGIREFANKFGIDFNFPAIPGIDNIGLGNVLEVFGANNKSDALLRQGKSVISEVAKPYREKLMEALPNSVKPLAGSALGQLTKRLF